MSDKHKSGKGLFLVFEGIEGCGKSTHTGLLAEHLRALGREVITTREPGGTEEGERIRDLLVSGAAGRWTPHAEALLHSAARAEHIARLILPALKAGRDVVCDRFADSTFAYQAGGQGADAGFILQLNALTTAGCLPDKVFLLDMPVEAAWKRVEARGGKKSRYEQLPLAVHEKIRRAFLELAAAQSETHCVIEAEADKEQVSAAVRAELEALLA